MQLLLARTAEPPNMSVMPRAASSLRALGQAHHAIEAGHHRRAVVAEAIERAGHDQRFEDALADDLRIDALAEILEACELPFPALGDDVLDRRVADALQRRQRIEDAVLPDLEVAEAGLDRWRDHFDAEPQRILAEVGQLVGVAHVERHRRREELDRMMRLEIGGLVGHHRIGGGMRLVEAVVGELRQQVEDEVGLRLGQSALYSAARRNARAARPSRRGSSCPWRGAEGRLRRANIRLAPARSASPVPGRR